MTLPWVTDAASAVQVMMGIGCVMIGLSHILQPKVWQAYFADLQARGTAGVLTRTALWELWPALIIVTFHQVWTGPAIVLTVFGWLLMIKCLVSLLFPQLGLRSIGMANRGPMVFVTGGLVSVAIGVAAFAALIW
jgi:hypothetical protein